ncbi:zinc finger protein 221 isoform X1 [Bactrocera tryoni]|uniref:zinc finger protein 221 isoform X1 n=1 Tax=Bactrocera tryoni TaxID=59916 RepID=UPI001A96148C|nr:zinc finger protein 221 isoform X1 [Bactrocera tryoni]
MDSIKLQHLLYSMYIAPARGSCCFDEIFSFNSFPIEIFNQRLVLIEQFSTKNGYTTFRALPNVILLEVFLNDGMPSSVCLKCRLTFDYCYRFKQMCKKAENLLSQVPLLGEWPSPLMKPIIPPELLQKQLTTHKENKKPIQQLKYPTSKEQSQQPSQSQQSSIAISKVTNIKPSSLSVSTPRKILNSNPAPLPEPPVPARMKKNKNVETFTFLTKVENNEEISFDDVQRLIASEDGEFTKLEPQDYEVTPASTFTNIIKKKPKLLNKSSMRILNKEADVDAEPRLKLPEVKHDEDGNVSIVTEILDPNEPYENESDPIKNAAPVKTNVFPCPHCSRTFPLLQLRDIHLVNHTRERHYPCTDCDRSFFSKYDLQKHTVIHTGERKYKCTVCDRGFTRPALLQRHEKIHTDIPKFLCVFCEKAFLSKDAMEKHAERHRKNRPFKCKVCSKAFAFKQGLERHEVVHSREQPYPCQYCDQSFCTQSKLARHLVAHAGDRPFPCKFCPKSYLLSHHLSRHMRTHKESVVMYSCNECDQVYRTCNELVMHSTVHATDTLTCPLCQQVFDDVDSVTSHIMEHANNESFPCEFCDLIFLTYNEQNYHVKSAHASDVAAYNEDENNTKRKKHCSDEEFEETIEEFLYDDDAELDINTNQSVNNEKQNNSEETKMAKNEDEEHYEAEYLKIEEIVSADEEMVAEVLSEINEDQEPVLKKSKVNPSKEKVQVLENEIIPMRRKATNRNPQNAERTTSQKSRVIVNQNLVARRGRPSTVSLTTNEKNAPNDDNKNDTPTSSKNSKVLEALGSRSKQIDSKAIIPKKDGVSPVKTYENIVRTKAGEKGVRVQKIVTKAEAAAMVKDGRIRINEGKFIRIKDGNSPKSSK